MLLWLVNALLAYTLGAYVLAPLGWRIATRRTSDLSGGPRITRPANGIVGDPINIALVGSESEVMRSMVVGKWYPADAITLRTSLRIAVDSVFGRPDDSAPVRDIFLFGRKQNLAFERPVGDSPRQRHHVRFWHSDTEADGRVVWFGSATFDTRVGLSHTTGQITHHIGPDIDAERDPIMSELKEAVMAQEAYYVKGFHTGLQGRHGGGDPWHTDGRLGVLVLTTVTTQPSAQLR